MAQCNLVILFVILLFEVVELTDPNFQQEVDQLSYGHGTNVKIPSSVVALNSDNFDEIALDKTKDVLVEFFTPWCQLCKSRAPDYDKVATAFKREDDVVVAAIDVRNHNHIGVKYSIRGFPTIKFFSKANKAGEDYDGGIDLNDLVTFLNSKCSTSRNWKGLLTSDAGVVADLDNLVNQFLNAGKDEKRSVYARLEKEADKLRGRNAGYGKIYLEYAKSWMDEGADYLKNEIQRLDYMLAKSTNAEIVDQLTLRKNILSVFVFASP